MKNEELNELISAALTGDSHALENIIIEIQDLVFNLSLRMLGTIADAEDASQDILIRIITRLSTFQGKSSFKTWVYRISCNYLIDYKKNMFSQYPLDFDFYSNDIKTGFLSYHCGLTKTGFCCCEKRVSYAIQQNRINPKKLDYMKLKTLDHDILEDYKNSMETIDDLALLFEELPHYQSNLQIKAFLNQLLQSDNIQKIQDF